MSVEHSRPEMLSPNRQVNIENSKTSNHHNSSLSSVSSLSPKNAANNLKMMLMSPNKNVNFDSIASSAGSVASSSANSTNSSNVVVVANTNPMKTSMGDLDLQKLPANIKFELDQLELELLEGDITQKGYDKKRARLLEGYLKSLHAPHLNSNDAKTDTKSKEKIRIYRKRNKEDVSTNRYHSEIRQEAVKAALALHSNPSESVVLASKRNTAYFLHVNSANIDSSTSLSTNILNENTISSSEMPFPVEHIKNGIKTSLNKLTNTNKNYSDNESSDEDMDEMYGENMIRENLTKAITNTTVTPSTKSSSSNSDEMILTNSKQPATVLAQPENVDSSGTSSLSNSSHSNNNIMSNAHVNQYYFHLGELQANQQASAATTATTEANLADTNIDDLLLEDDANLDKEIEQLANDMSRFNYVPHQKTDRVVAVKNNYINSNSKCILKMQEQKEKQKKLDKKKSKSKEDKKSKTSSSESKTNNIPDTSSPIVKSSPQEREQSVVKKLNSIETNALNNSLISDNDLSDIRQPTRVSAKIQQLLDTLKRPKRRPLNEYFEDNQEELEIPRLDPAVPKPEGGLSVPACGEPLIVPASFPQSIEAAIHKFAIASSKSTCISILDQYGKPASSITYVKLLNRVQRAAYHLLNKLILNTQQHNGEEISLKQGDRVALVFPNNDPIGFTVAFCACLMGGLVALPIDVPLIRRDAGSQNLGFLLGQVGASVILTSELCYKALPKNPNTEAIEFKGWPKVPWLVLEHLNKSPPKDWSPPNRISSESIAYIEYSCLKDGSVTGVAVTREQMLSHCQTLNVACQYTEGEIIVSVLDFKREFGLWHGIQSTILNGMHMLYVPYSVMKVNPSIWLSTITKHKASVALVKSRDMHWGLMAQREHKDISLLTLRMLLVADGANPWSLTSCDTFLDVFQSKGLKPESICPTAGSSETLTISIRRPNRTGAQSSGRGVLSMSGLSYGVVRVDQENSLTSLTIQDVGQVLPGSLVAVVKLNSISSTTSTTTSHTSTISSTHQNQHPVICQTDEVGEICISSKSTANGYFGLNGLSTNVFKVTPHSGVDQAPIGTSEYVRSGLLGFLGPGGLVFVCGSKEGLIEVSSRRHNTDDIIATVLAVEPMKFIYRGRIAVFSIKVLKDERIVIVAEQRPDSSEEECFQWMSRVLQAVDSIHQAGVYCLALVPPNTLPKTPLGGIHIPETRSKFIEGCLHPSNILMCPHTCVLNLPKPREHHPEREVGPSAVLAGSIIQGRRLAEAKGRDLFDDESDTAKKYQFLGDILRWRSATNPDHCLYTVMNSKGQEIQKLTCAQLHKKAEKIACLLLEKGQLNNGDHVALVFPPSVDLVAAFYGCLYIGVIPVPIRPPHVQNIQTTLPTIKMIVEMGRIKGVLTQGSIIKLLKSKEANAIIDSRQWPTLLDVDDNTKKKLSAFYRPSAGESLCYLDFSVSTTGMLTGVQMSHASSTGLCRAIKLSCELYPSREVVLCLDPYSGLSFVLWCLNSVYSGHHSILVPPIEVEMNPCIWLATVSHYKVRDTFCSYSVMELCTKGLRATVIDLKSNSSSSYSSYSTLSSNSSFPLIKESIQSGTLLKSQQLKSRGINLSCVRTCAIIAEERPRIQLTSSFIKLFQSLGLPARSVSTTFGCRANIAVCLQGASDPDPTSVYVDQRALRNDRVTIVEKGSPHSLCLLESGKLLPGVKVVIANPETKGQCADSHLGEIWIQSQHNSNGYYNFYGGDEMQNDHFNCHLATGDTLSTYARTGYLGFVRRIEESTLMPNSEPHDAIYIVGSLDETLMIRGMRYHPIDIETTVLRSHKKICECACFTWTNLLVVVVELDGNENEALDLIPIVTNSVLEDHYLIVGVVVVVDPGVVPINSRGEKQRMHLRDGFLSDMLDPIYVAYNM